VLQLLLHLQLLPSCQTWGTGHLRCLQYRRLLRLLLLLLLLRLFDHPHCRHRPLALVQVAAAM
jgi:hypothetical protein